MADATAGGEKQQGKGASHANRVPARGEGAGNNNPNIYLGNPSPAAPNLVPPVKSWPPRRSIT
eukprot:1391470-Lingulodinium_polyedra.AAC.1